MLVLLKKNLLNDILLSGEYMKEVKSSLIKQKLNLDRYLQDNVEKSKIDIISLRDIVA